MAKVSVIYRAPKGDAKVCEWGDFTFFDGVPVEVEANEHTEQMIKKIASNRYFELSEMGTVNQPEATPKPPEPVADPEPAPVPEEHPETGPEPAPEEHEDQAPALPKQRKTMTTRAKARPAKTPKERITARRKRAGW